MDDNDALGPVVCRAEDREKDSSISFSNGATDARKHMEYHPLAQQTKLPSPPGEGSGAAEKKPSP